MAIAGQCPQRENRLIQQKNVYINELKETEEGKDQPEAKPDENSEAKDIMQSEANERSQPESMHIQP